MNDIKIIFSGTFDGFSPRYASDGILDDDITQLIVDRRRYLSKDTNALYKMGYSFQPINKGILFHKIVLLFDGFGREGFMMASLFLPIGKLLSGADIKDALDSLIRDYKACTSNGMVSVEIDWSFVNRKADELNSKVKEVEWRKRPLSYDATKTALISGVSDRVADYFQYPVPLHKGCENFGQVFLTDSLLDPSMASDVDTQGYQVIPKELVDIDNPTYSIEYTGGQEFYNKKGLKTEISQKELSEGRLSCGELTALGYRSQSISIPADSKSEDGVTLKVFLPKLIQKSAKVRLTILNTETNESISIKDCDEITWNKVNGGSMLNRYPKGDEFEFIGDECDHEWDVTIEIPDFKTATERFYIGDNDDKTCKVKTKSAPSWTIKIKYPNDEPVEQHSGILEENLETEIKRLKIEINNRGYDVPAEPRKDEKKRTVTLRAKEKEYLLGDHSKQPTPKKTDGKVDREINTQPAESKCWYLYLDEKSKDYSIFKKEIPTSQPAGAKYDKRLHRLELYGNSSRDYSNEGVKFVNSRDNYSYYLDGDYKWVENELLINKYKVQRKLKPKIKGIIAACATVVLAVAGLITFFAIRSNQKVDLSGFTLNPEFTAEKPYCGDNLFKEAEETYNAYTSSGGDTSSKEFENFKKCYDRHKSYKEDYDEIVKWLNSLGISNYDVESFEKALKGRGIVQSQNVWKKDVFSKEQQIEINTLINDFIQNLKQIKDAEKAANQAVIDEHKAYEDAKKSPQGCNNYLRKYPNGTYVDAVKIHLNQFETKAYNKCTTNPTKENCNYYLSQFKKYNQSHTSVVEQKLKDISQVKNTEETTSSPTPQPPGSKKTISTPKDLFNYLSWENIKNGLKWFDDHYNVIGEKLNNDKNYVCNRVSNLKEEKKINKDKYQDIYTTASKESNASDKIKKLGELLKNAK